MPEANPELENSPPRALQTFRPTGADERELLVAEFRKDAGSLSSRASEKALEGLFASSDPITSQSNTRSRRTNTLLFSRHVLAPGADRVTAPEVSDPVAHIIEVSPPHSAGRASVPAIGTRIAPAGNLRLRSMGITCLATYRACQVAGIFEGERDAVADRIALP